MKKFRFTLAAVQTVRQRQEQLALEQYARAVRAWQSALSALQDVQRQSEAAWQLRRERVTAGVSAAELARLQEYSDALDDLKKQCEVAVAMARRLVDQKLEKLHEARRSRRAVDKFFERQRARHRRALQREEQKTLDELAQHRAPQTILLGAEMRWELV